MKIKAIHLGLVFALVAMAYVPFGASANHNNGLTIKVETDQETYQAEESVEITISAKNTSSRARTLHFNSGCQTAYLIANSRGRVVYDSLDDQICTQALTSVTIAAGQTKTWTMTHDQDEYDLQEGDYIIVGEVLGYGDDETEISIEEEEDDMTIEVLSPDGGEQWKLGQKKTIRWEMPRVWNYGSRSIRAQDVDIFLVDQDGDEYTIEEEVYDDTYRWKVGETEDGDRVPRGKYKIKVCLGGTNTCDSSDSFFRIVR
jgi:hypothetical protein